MEKESFEQRCVAINNTLSGQPKGQTEQFMYRNVFQPGLITRKYRRRKVFYCSECGSEIGVLTQKKCPVCHAKWKGVPTEDKMGTERFYHMELEAKGDIQLCRIYRVERTTWYGKAASSNVWEVERIMYAPTGERKVFARGVQTMSWYYDAFCYGPIKLKREKYSDYYNKAQLRYNLSMITWHIRSLTEQWRYKEINALLNQYDGDTSVLRVIAYPWGETMRKTGQEKLFRYLVNQYKLLPRGSAHALNICTRNHYVIDDTSMWLDNLELLRHFHMDTHNAHYVCPKDLRALHQELLQRKRREDERKAAERREREEQERMRKDKAYADMMQHWPERMGAILTLSLNGNDLAIRPLQSIDEFKQEGEAMHHCVYSMKYYDYNRRPNCLILSAKDAEGNRLATIEYDTKRNDIVQCRAACNGVPERDAEIRELITSHRNDFEKLMKAA